MQKKTYEELIKLKYEKEIAINAAETFGANIKGAIAFLKSDDHDDEDEPTFLTQVKHGKKVSIEDVSKITDKDAKKDEPKDAKK